MALILRYVTWHRCIAMEREPRIGYRRDRDEVHGDDKLVW